jgi:hypothetical protein
VAAHLGWQFAQELHYPTYPIHTLGWMRVDPHLTHICMDRQYPTYIDIDNLLGAHNQQDL